ncbi:hypothetical protein NKR19_g1184 [Coniochaeta hoffmannii]|uniref:Uncharacterized protein n=1 Tax=Coniochaeta hoffmannii TaxID=91930 RepID=A0AA38SKY2_9PEZI|nr:hypothetical protein NKR19_g1184 [Coniochaeta hoffmannii]
MSTKDFAALKPVISRDKPEPRQRTAANGGGEPPSTPEVSMFDEWLAEHDKTNLVVTEVLLGSGVGQGGKPVLGRL